MSQYDKLDLLIFEAIKTGARDFGSISDQNGGAVRIESQRLYADNPSGKPPFRHVDTRLQALRKRGLIEFKRPIGWRVKEAA